MSTALITGITGQDGSYLAEYLLEKGYNVFGVVRRSSSFNTGRIDHLLEGYPIDRFNFYRGDLGDLNSLVHIIKEVEPDEIYHLAAQSHVRVSFDIPIYTFDIVSLGTLKLLEAIKFVGITARVYFAGSSEMFGSSPPPQNEDTPFRPRSTYAAGKVAAFNLCQIYREAYNMWIACGIMFNHESPRRGETFVTRKITRAIARMKLGIEEKLYLGNLDAKRDWGYAPDYVEAMWLMLQQDKPDDCVIATGESHTVREFAEVAFNYAGFTMKWEGSKMNEKVIDVKSGKTLIEIASRYFRPLEVQSLLGNAGKAKNTFNWKPKIAFNDLVTIMVDADIRRERMLLEGTKSVNEVWRTHI